MNKIYQKLSMAALSAAMVAAPAINVFAAPEDIIDTWVLTKKDTELDAGSMGLSMNSFHTVLMLVIILMFLKMCQIETR